ncbi:MAG: PIG-L deacetylase family protein [Candidatus Levybacteria bacterium]|nr:PIG-L deacetylase family protein [Candidatus Levybacteria bacterium]
MKILFVFAHPDDESFSSGGTISKLAKAGVDVRLITATRGEKGQVGNPPLCKQEDLGKFREKELRCAAKILGVSQIYFLDYIDATLHSISKKEISDKILSILKVEKPDAVVTFNKEGGSRHPDHIQVGKSATLAFEKYMENAKKHVRLYHGAMPRSFVKKIFAQGTAYTVYGKIRGTPDFQITTKVDISDTIEDKIKALKCHQTQKKDWERFLKRKDYKEFKMEFFRLVMENEIG